MVVGEKCSVVVVVVVVGGDVNKHKVLMENRYSAITLSRF